MIIRNITGGNYRRYPDKIAVISGETRYTYKQLHERTNRLANALFALGMKKGDILSVFADLCPQYPEVLCMSVKTGIALAPYMISTAPDDLTYLLNNCKSKVVIFAEQYHKIFDALRPELKYVEKFICIGKHKHPSQNYEDLIASFPSSEPNLVNISYDDLCYVGASSGTTGRPKQTMRTYENSLSASLQICYALDIGSEDVFFQPCVVSFGIGAWRVLFHLGVTCILPNTFTPEVVLETIQREKITKIFATANLIRELINYDNVNLYDTSTVKRIWVTGAPLSKEEWVQAIDIFGSVFVQAYSTAEQSPVAILQPKDFILDSKSEKVKRLQSCGQESIDSRVRIIDENGNDVKPGEIGEIITEGGALIKGYLNAPNETKEAIRDGFLHTGDLGRMDKDNFIYLLGRKKEAIIIDGKTVLPYEVEFLLLSHPFVIGAVVIGIPDDIHGHKILGIVIKKGNVSQNELIALCKNNLNEYAIPSQIEFVQSYPKTASGKVMKYKLIEQYNK